MPLIQTHSEHNGNGNGSGGKYLSPGKNNLLSKGWVATSGVIIAPYIGDLLNLGNTNVPEIMNALHGHGVGTGLAGGINSLLNMVPYAGETLSAGGFATAASSGIIGIGGILLGNYIDKKHSKPDSIPWGKVIKYAALTTSILIALPSILTGISVGLAYLASFAGAGIASGAIASLSATLGATGAVNVATAGAGISSALTHLITCGGAALSLAGAIYLDKNNDTALENSPNIQIAGKPVIQRGQPCTVAFRINDKNGQAVTPADMSETYTKKLHVMMVDSSLSDYHHLHPEYDKTSGLFMLSFVPKIQGEYNVWSDFTLQNGSNIILKNKISAEQGQRIPPSIHHTNSVIANDINVNIDVNPPLSAGQSSTIRVRITNKSGKPVTLDPIMGAYAHLAGFSKDGEDFIHCHPLNIQPESNKSSTDGDLQFHAVPKKDGFTKFFLQLKINDRETAIPFGQYVQASEQFTQKDTHRPLLKNTSDMNYGLFSNRIERMDNRMSNGL